MYLNRIKHWVRENAVGYNPSNRFDISETLIPVCDESSPWRLQKAIENNFFLNLFRKMPGSADHELTFAKFLDREEKNKKINFFLRNGSFSGDAEHVLDLWIKHTRDLLCVDPIPLGSLTTGATTHSKKGDSQFSRFTTTGITRSLSDFLQGEPVLPCDYPWVETVFDLGSNAEVIDKDGNIGRLIHPEPAANMFYQRGYGLQIADLYRKRGYNIPLLPDKHIALAKRASIDKSLATIDLSNGNLNLPTELVRKVLPPLWFDHLNAARSHVTVYKGKPYTLETFVTAGNGFCFELESVLFFTLVTAICRYRGHKGPVSVYGDDILCPDAAYDDVTRCMQAFGMDINDKKSFHGSSPFRESCGGDFINGIPCRPVFIKSTLEDIGDVVVLHNQCFERFGGQFCPPLIRRFMVFLRSIIFSESKVGFGPSYIEGCVHTDYHRFYGNRTQVRKRLPNSTDNLGRQVAGKGRKGRELFYKVASYGLLPGLGGSIFVDRKPRNFCGPIHQYWRYASFQIGGTAFQCARVSTLKGYVDERNPLSVFDLDIPVSIKYSTVLRRKKFDNARHADKITSLYKLLKSLHQEQLDVMSESSAFLNFSF